MLRIGCPGHLEISIGNYLQLPRLPFFLSWLSIYRGHILAGRNTEYPYLVLEFCT